MEIAATLRQMDQSRGIALRLPMVFEVRNATIRDAMQAIQVGSANAAFAIDENDVLVGLVTDGDIRRALLAGSALVDPVYPLVRSEPVTASPSESRSSVLDLMQSRGISQVPVVDQRGQVVAIHLLRELIGRINRPNWAVVLAGGRGTRLRPVTETIPKPMVTVAGRPILERIVNHLVGYGIQEIVLSVGYLAQVIEDHFGDGSSYGCRIRYVREDADKPLGTAGSLGLVRESLGIPKRPVLVLNGDLVTQFSVSAFLEHHSGTKSVVSVGSLSYRHQIPYGVLDLDQHGNVKQVVEKPIRQETVSGGMYVIEPSVLERVPAGEFVPMTQILENCIHRGERVSTWTIDQDWLDVGRPEELLRARGHNE